MATDRPFMRKRLLGMAVETTTGTAVALAGTNAGYLVYDPKITPNITNERREIPAYQGQVQSVPGGARENAPSNWSLPTARNLHWP